PGEDLHVAREDHEVDPKLSEQGELLGFHLVLVPLRDRKTAELDAELSGERFEIRMVAHDDRHLDGSFSRMAPRENVVESPGLLRHENGQANRNRGNVKRPFGVGFFADDRAEIRGHLVQGPWKTAKRPTWGRV